MAYTHWMLDTLGYRHTHRICKTYCFSTGTLRLDITLYVHCLSCYSCIFSHRHKLWGVLSWKGRKIIVMWFSIYFEINWRFIAFVFTGTLWNMLIAGCKQQRVWLRVIKIMSVDQIGHFEVWLRRINCERRGRWGHRSESQGFRALRCRRTDSQIHSARCWYTRTVHYFLLPHLNVTNASFDVLLYSPGH